ncbi:RNase J family beta-CASP ribonuclease, partial [Candidatus Woesearchaeota archaeon]|nr:RNase J family beta-CASP ribonuclease [Candidatus Woesearchaeota archaeon]
MSIEICAVGGFSEVGRNCTAVKIDDDVIILDMGLHMENYVKYTEEEDLQGVTEKQLIAVSAVPDFAHMDEWKHQVRAIVPSHAHLDHIGAIPFLAHKFNVPIIATPYTIEVIKALCKDKHVKNKLVRINPNSTFQLTEKIMIEFIHVTHSTPQTAIVALHTPYGTILYANDFKLDNSPVLGSKPNYKRLKQLRGKVVLLIMECLYVDRQGKMPSESVARQLLKGVMLETKTEGKAIIVTTFSSHIARLKSITEFGKKLNRKVVFLGSSLNKYVTAAENIKLINFTKHIGMVYYGQRARKMLTTCAKQKDKYLLVMTGHQGEPKAMLSRIANGEYHFPLANGDFVIFSALTIPTPPTIANRKALEMRLQDTGVRIFTDIHVSGHSAREDLHDFILMVQPRHIIPTHAEPGRLALFAELAYQLGYEQDKVHILFNGQKVKV